MTERKSRAGLLAALIAAAAAVAVCAASFFFFRGSRLTSALEKLDVTDSVSVINVMKYGADEPDAVFAVASAYSEARMYSDAARFCLYALQYLDGGEEFAVLLKDAYSHLGADPLFLSQFDSADYSAGDFAVATRFADFGYGGDDGVYIEFCGGYACAKLSSVVPLSLAAVDGGVYALSAADDRIVLISDDGLSVTPVTDARVSEFLLSDGALYYIDADGTPVAPSGSKPLADGERAMELREVNGVPTCSVYDENYNKLRDMQL